MNETPASSAPVLELASFLITPPPEKAPLFGDLEEAATKINEALRVQEAWARTFKAMKDLPGNDETLVEIFDQKLTMFGELDEDQVQGAQIGMLLVLGSFREMIANNLVLPGKEDFANQIIARVERLMSVLEKHTHKE